MAIMTCKSDGKDPQVLWSSGTWPSDSSDVLRHCVGVALSPGLTHIYWTQKGPPDGGQGRIFRARLESKTADGRIFMGEPTLLAFDLPEPIDLEISPDGRHLFWTDRGLPQMGGNSLNRARIEDNTLRDHVILSTGFKEPIGLAMDFDGQVAFVSDLSGSIYEASLNDGSVRVIHQCAGPATGLALNFAS
ncbi:hypothetical protein J5H37_13280 [Stenotrophomonas maltophilia]|uniref:YncE family protein n=2 Tax=Stenotrophomonas maltophilia TaxID=40324 RepID=UPI0019D49F8B|nr:hypothetical protein [Stenotrophomonas maltophilia]MBN7831731.1 hypothetical protein [Stenotrophomonas maltophilia]MBN7833559.1 hypothetical protein [Stenotrophomonas maltophilia]MBN7859970.1 hypothetical protein [Stenotrophomonas maltophilia]MBO2846690.1 hypothetical protein [Stenotrophomonas maltophilia]MBO2881353.1 hypothetical protein [Stenotrophomonas maltophilia]